jgi:hypothetical protein
MVVVEHLILAILFIIELVVPDASALTMRSLGVGLRVGV